MLDRSVSDRIKRNLSSPADVCKKLGLLSPNAQRQARGLIILCPWHGEKTPSCSVRAVDGTIAVKCHGCGQGGDVFSLIAAARGLTLPVDFRRVLEEAAQLANVSIDDPAPSPSRRPPPPVEPERDYPARGEVLEFWGSCTPVSGDEQIAAWLLARKLEPGRVEVGDLARAIPASGKLPRWSMFRGSSWRDTGHRLIVPMFDHRGEMRSVRAGRVVDGDSPKRLPPGGHRASGLVMACELGRAMLAGTWQPERVIVCEGEPDFFTWATRNGVHARLGITSGSWNEEIAARVPDRCAVAIWSDDDDAGRRYATQIRESLAPRCRVAQ